MFTTSWSFQHEPPPFADRAPFDEEKTMQQRNKTNERPFLSTARDPDESQSLQPLSGAIDDIALCPKLAARFVGLSPKTLANYRLAGGGRGPSFVKGPGRRGYVRYPLSQLQKYRENLLRQSTSDEGRAL